MQRIWKILKAIEPINRTEEAVFILYIEKVRSKKMVTLHRGPVSSEI
ncbi:MAG TPA: hypothetical protein PKZ70_02595 [Candidatus Atribacteria bacterium]|nr:hypothetical protein [Candidatus Atribacteria bacterium]